MVAEITPSSLKERREASNAPLVLDVREPWELEIVRLPGTLDIPMNEIPARLSELPKERDIVVMCHAGGRSLNVARYLERLGYRVANLAGGIHAWTCEVDPTLRTY
jgi:rhodanese-related sulfurtransferase